MLIGYARVSTRDQNLDSQTDALRRAGCERIFEDKVGGASREPPGLKAAFDILRSGDALVVWRLDRLGRSLSHLLKVVNELRDGNIELKSLHESIDTASPAGTLIFHVFGALAEFERNLIRERTRAGLAAARARGRLGGRPKALDPGEREAAIKLYNDKTHTVSEVCRIMGITKPTLYSYLREKESS